MSFRKALPILLALLLAACTTKPKTETAEQPPPAPVVADPTPPAPPNSVELPADIKHLPTFLLLAVGGLGSEGEKEGIEMQENLRLFRTEAAAPEIVSFYAKEMKDRGWTTDNQAARSAKLGLTMLEYQRAAAGEALYVIISEPEGGELPDPEQSKRHVALLPAKRKKKAAS